MDMQMLKHQNIAMAMYQFLDFMIPQEPIIYGKAQVDDGKRQFTRRSLRREMSLSHYCVVFVMHFDFDG